MKGKSIICFETKARKYLQHRCVGYFAFVVDIRSSRQKLSVNDVPIVKELPNVFPDDFLGVPPVW